MLLRLITLCSFIVTIGMFYQCTTTKDTVDSHKSKFETKTTDYIFDQSRLHTFEINLPEENLSKIDSDPAAEEYVAANLLFDGETIAPVGLRYKGSIGSFVNCVSGEDWINPSGYKTCTKLSMKIKVDWEDSNNQFYGMKKIQLYSMNHDKSQMRDRLGYLLFKEMGVPAPRSTHAKVVINGQYVGLFALIEQIDDRFTALHFNNDPGSLFKELWPHDQNGNPTTKIQLPKHLEGNESGESRLATFSDFALDIGEASDDQIKQVISRWMDISEIMSYAVVDRAIRADDGPFHWYCFGGSCAPHNFYCYANSAKKKIHLLPWDMDNAFENMTEDTNPVTPIADEWGQITADCEPFPSGKFNILQRSAACDKLTSGWVQFDSEYKERMF